MANLSNIARPYALAAFECGRETGQLPQWKALLESAAYIAKQPTVVRILANPQIRTSDQYELFKSVLASTLNEKQANCLRLLADNRRLMVLPEIADTFNSFYAELEKVSKVRVVTAVTAKESFREKLIQSLTKRFKHNVTLQCEIDPAILGGAIIHIGDHVIDGSIRGKLTRLLEFSLR